MSKKIINCYKCGKDFSDYTIDDTYRYEGEIYCGDCLRPVSDIVYFEMDGEPFIETEQVEEVYLTDGVLESE